MTEDEMVGWHYQPDGHESKQAPGVGDGQGGLAVQLFANSRTAALQASLSFTLSQSFLKLLSIELMMPSSHLTLCHSFLLLPSIFPSIRVFSVSQLFASNGQSIGASASASVLPMNILG